MRLYDVEQVGLKKMLLTQDQMNQSLIIQGYGNRLEKSYEKFSDQNIERIK